MNTNLNISEIITAEINRLSAKYNKDFLDCEDIIKITGLGRDNVRNLLRSKEFPATKVGNRYVVSIANFVSYISLQNYNKEAK